MDMFYVLSSFLITSIVADQLQRSDFSFVKFYLSRLRRLAPAYLVCLIFVSIAASVLLVPDDFIAYMSSLKHALLFDSNVKFADITGGYFSSNAEQMPLLHTWSLSLEWQFYFIWPVIFYLCYRFLRFRAFLVLLLLAFVAAIGYGYYLAEANPIKSYYLLTGRGFELMAGALLALLISYLPRVEGIFAHLLSILAIVVIVALAVVLDGTSLFPGLNGLWVTLATLLLIYTGRAESLPIGNRLLSWKPMVGIGLISYSIYLWHWPIFAFIRYLQIELKLFLALGAMALAFILSYLTWIMVEKPMRFKYVFGFKRTVAFFWFIPILLVLSLSHLIKSHDGFPGRFGDKLTGITQVIDAASTQSNRQCHEIKSMNATECQLESEPSSRPRPNTLLIGDSHARHYRDFVEVLAQDSQHSFISITGKSCLTVPGVYLLQAKKYIDRCALFVPHLYAQIEEIRPEFVILAQRWIGYSSNTVVHSKDDEQSIALSRGRLEKALTQTIEAFIDKGITPGNDRTDS